MTDDEIKILKADTRHLFYHGYDNYMLHAFPDDELKPLSCQPQTRNRDNPADIGLNDVLGNYSVTLIDSLSTLAILASDEDERHAKHALMEFQGGVSKLVDLYGDGSKDEKTGGRDCGTRACAFHLDSKVQVFETNIRGVGGLLSAHLFAVGDLPIRGYDPTPDKDGRIKWKGLRYDGQLLRLAHDLAERLLPAFDTPTGMPYPRVNLRHGIPFYRDSEAGVCRLDGTSSDPREITETCSAGAGSLVLEFATLSRLTGDMRFEGLAKRAFWAVWRRRSGLGLIGGGIDAESGMWTSPPLAGIGAGIDSFFEYALKSHILLSGLSPPATPNETTSDDNQPNDSSSAFLTAWQDSHAAIKRHIYRPASVSQHPYYAQSDLLTGAPRYTWIDNLSAYYPGLLTLAGELEEAIEAHLTYAALWTRYAALPERWMAHNSFVDPSFRHWAGRPEFVESTWYLFQATRDPWFLHTGEMVLRDVRRRCWARCGWASLADVGTGEQMDRMESFFLGETVKYLFLLFDEGHPLNGVDGAVVFSTEGHPLVIPKRVRKAGSGGGGEGVRAGRSTTTTKTASRNVDAATAEAPGPQQPPAPTCPAPAPPIPLTISNVAARPDLFHAASLAQLHLVPIHPSRTPLNAPLQDPADLSSGPGTTLQDLQSPTNYTFYPWTLPRDLIPVKGRSSPIRSPVTSTLTFPNLGTVGAAEGSSGGGGGVGGDGEGKSGAPGVVALGALQKVLEGVFVNSLSHVRLNMVREDKHVALAPAASSPADVVGGAVGTPGMNSAPGSEFRIHGIANWALGRDEKVLVAREALERVSPVDPHFTRVKDLEMVDLVVDTVVWGRENTEWGPDVTEGDGVLDEDGDVELEWPDIDIEIEDAGVEGMENGTVDSGLWTSLEAMFASLLGSQPTPTPPSSANKNPSTRLARVVIPAILPMGVGAAPFPASLESASDPLTLPGGKLPFTSIFFLDSTLCDHRLPAHVAKENTILILLRGGCAFNDKLANIPTFGPGPESLQLVIVVSTPESLSEGERAEGGKEGLIRPLLDQVQRSPSGLVRRDGIAMVMVEGDEETVRALKGAARKIGMFGEDGGLVVEDGEGVRGGGVGGETGLAVKRRFWFESMGVPIGNLIVV
ncbi:hypothetical protein LTR78_003549 [Recurvomyces mirabilis]|uniref:alpha-1,2-Mannosidase n=2 Tax=Recurvomyces mirabilis TaxID=574656 RepID=A0AAE1C3G8_9PEZI|nr:hypothetical protein LTR78_003549 [Recurvomyces mirabilis]